MKNIFLTLQLFFFAAVLVAQEDAQFLDEPHLYTDSTDMHAVDDSVQENILYGWNYRIGGLMKKRVVFDTLYDYAYDFKISDQVGISANTLPTTYSPFISNSIFARISVADFPFASSIDHYFTHPEDAMYLKSSRPVSMIAYSNRGKTEEQFEVFHSQMVNRDFCFGLDFKVGGITEPRYHRSEEGYRSFSAFADYNGVRYRGRFNINYGRLVRSESGGFMTDSAFADDDFTTQAASVYLTRAESFTKYSSVLVSQELNLGRTQIIYDSANYVVKPYLLSAGFDMQYSSYMRKFTDDEPNNDYYQLRRQSDSLEFVDSAYYYQTDNKAFVSFAPSFGKSSQLLLKAGAGLLMEQYLNSDVLQEQPDKLYTSSYLEASALLSLAEDISAAASLRKYVMGRRQDETVLSFFAARSVPDSSKGLELNAEFNFAVKPASLAQQFYSAETVFWKNEDFDNQVDLSAQIEAELKQYRLCVAAKAEALGNHIYFDQSLQPKQASDGVILAGLIVEKDSRWKIFGMTNRLIGQFSSNNEVVAVPQFVSSNSLYLHGPLFKHNLYLKLGGELKYFTAYKAPFYDPATSLFYVQNDEELGGDASVNIFLNLRFKRMAFFIKMENFNSAFDLSPVYSSFGYPQYKMHVAYGLKWYFYN